MARNRQPGKFMEPIGLVWSSISNSFSDSGKWFSKDHDQYCEWLRLEIKRLLSSEDITELLRHLGFDWLTLHYRTRHPREDWSRDRDWIQLGFPVEARLSNDSSRLLAYREGVSPYIAAFSEQRDNPGEPVLIQLGPSLSNRASAEWTNALALDEVVVQILVELTEGSVPQGPFTAEELNSAISVDGQGVTEIVKQIGRWTKSEWPPQDCLGLLRNACRVTLLGLKTNSFRLPRMVVLAPTYVEHNVIGGISFIGPDSNLRPSEGSIVQYLATSLLNSLRLREEEHRESSIAQVEELERARAEFVQRIAHGLQAPLDSLLLRVSDAIKELRSIEGEVKKLRDAADEIIVAFAKKNVDELLRLKPTKMRVSDLLDTIQFMNIRAFSQRNIELEIRNSLPPAATLTIDKAGFLEVVGNLLANALRYARKRVEILTERATNSGAENSYFFKVIDDGRGIHESVAARLFQPGVREAPSSPDQTKTHGYGLYLSRRLIEKLGGKLTLTASTGSRTEFTIEMPERSGTQLYDRR